MSTANTIFPARPLALWQGLRFAVTRPFRNRHAGTLFRKAKIEHAYRVGEVEQMEGYDAKAIVDEAHRAEMERLGKKDPTAPEGPTPGG